MRKALPHPTLAVATVLVLLGAALVFAEGALAYDDFAWTQKESLNASMTAADKANGLIRDRYTVKNQEDVPLTDVHLSIEGGTFTGLPTGLPPGWKAVANGANQITITATDTAAAIPPGGTLQFDVVTRDAYGTAPSDAHIIRTHLTFAPIWLYDGPIPPSVYQEPVNQEPRYGTQFDQKRDADGNWGTDAQRRVSMASTVVGPSGGMLAVGDSQENSLVIPAGALADDSCIWACALPSETPDYLGPASDGAKIAKVLEFGPGGWTFDQPVTVAMHFSDAEVSGLDEDTLDAYWYDPGSGGWTQVPGAIIDSSSHVITFSTTHFSMYGIGGNPEPNGAEVVSASSTWSIALAVLGSLGVALVIRRRRAERAS